MTFGKRITNEFFEIYKRILRTKLEALGVLYSTVNG